jgi:HSP20 family protein
MMNLVRWNPWREMTGMHNQLNHMFDSPFFRAHRSDEDVSFGLWNPAADLYEKDDRFVIKAELAGVDKDNIAIDLKDGVLTLSGERSEDNEIEEDNYYRRERTYGKFRRAFSLPADVDSDKIKAEFKDGVLQIEVPKPEERKPKQITVH